ncbi:MAG: M23 family metallopeptidase, partial [Treponema sp.]|nr:M23 family metallopeptidase [Treponema sp.]
FGMFGINDRNGNLVKNGLLELHLGRKGATMNIGMGGADVSLGTIAASMSGLRDTLKIGGAKLASLVGSYEGISTLNAVNMLGYSDDTNNFALGRSIWGGKIRVRYGETGEDFGNYNVNDPNGITLSQALLGNGLDKSSKLATVMAHEGTHANGNRLESVAHERGIQTYGAIVAKLGLTADTGFAQQMLMGLLQANSYEENTGDLDHWKALKNADGTYKMIWDGKSAFDLSDIDPELLKANGLDPVVAADMIQKNAGTIAKLFKGQFSTEDIKSIGATSEAMDAAKEKIRAYEKDPRNFKQKEDLDNGINAALTLLNKNLYALQERGIISGNGTTVDTTNLAGSGTREDPYSPMVLKDGKLPVETLYGWRLVDKDLASVGASYELFNFAPFFHSGIDISQKGAYYASEAGQISLTMEKAKGLISNLSMADNRTLSYCHNGAEAIDAYMNAWGMNASGLTKGNDNYSLGVIAGTVIGYTGLTGATSGYHLHLEEDGGAKDPMTNYYKNLTNNNVFAISDYARYLSGIAPEKNKPQDRPAYNDPGVIANIVAYNKRNTTNFPLQGYLNAHRDVFPTYKLSPSKIRLYQLDEQTLLYRQIN